MYESFKIASMRKDKTVAIILSILTLLPLIYWIGVSGLFCLDMEVSKMKEISLKGKDYDLCIYYNPSNATVEESIQIHLVSKEDGEDKLYKY